MKNIDFVKEIVNFENNVNNYDYCVKKGKTPIMFTAVHTVNQYQGDSIKLAEPFTGAICAYVSNQINGFYLIKSIDNGIDANKDQEDDCKKLLLKIIKENNIKLLIDIHGAKSIHDFDVELGTLNNLTVDLTVQNTLIATLKEAGINKININHPFKGGGITKYIFANSNIDIIQIEINRKYRDLNNPHECKKLCTALTEFAKKYANFNS